MKRALINWANTVVQVEPTGSDFPVSSDFRWVNCPDNVEAYSWTYDGSTFSPPPPTPLETLKEAKLAQIILDRDAACYADVEVIGHTWQADFRSQALLSSAILMAQSEVYTPTTWRTADDVNVSVTLADLVQIAGTIAAQTEVAYAASWARKAVVDAATTAEEVEAA